MVWRLHDDEMICRSDAMNNVGVFDDEMNYHDVEMMIWYRMNHN